MADRKKAPAKPVADAETFMGRLEHPHKAGIDRLREVIRRIDPRIVEEVKWNAPSFRLEEHFATFKLHPPKSIQLVLHRGAKAAPPGKALELRDPHGLVKWAAPDRCVITLESSRQAAELAPEVEELVRSWISQL